MPKFNVMLRRTTRQTRTIDEQAEIQVEADTEHEAMALARMTLDSTLVEDVATIQNLGWDVEDWDIDRSHVIRTVVRYAQQSGE